MSFLWESALDVGNPVVVDVDDDDDDDDDDVGPVVTFSGFVFVVDLARKSLSLNPLMAAFSKLIFRETGEVSFCHL